MLALPKAVARGNMYIFTQYIKATALIRYYIGRRGGLMRQNMIFLPKPGISEQKGNAR
jgi:hypothetical protein